MGFIVSLKVWKSGRAMFDGVLILGLFAIPNINRIHARSSQQLVPSITKI